MADPFSGDILAEILKRLPPESVLRASCVQKSWYHLIRSPFFIDLHYNHHKKKSKHLLFQNRNYTRFSIHLDNKRWEKYRPHLRFPPLRCMRERKYYQKNYGTYRGLICFSIRRADTREKKLYLWNPAINKFRSLPKSPKRSNDQFFRHIKGLAFGYIGQLDDYKVIKLVINYRAQWKELQSDYAYVYIYSLSTNSWKTVGKYDFTRFSSYLLYNSVVVNGVAYWVLRKWYIEENDPCCFQVIICFDTVNETIREIMLPLMSSMKERHGRGYVNLVGEFSEVSLLCVDVEQEDIICKLWMLEKEGETNKAWTQMIAVNLSYVDQEYRFPIGFNNNLELVLIKHDFEKPGFCSYDLETQEVTEVVNDSSDLWAYADFEDPENPRYDYGYDSAFTHFSQEEMQPMYVNSFEETLVLLGEEDEVELKDD
ncbi:F-box protein CPR1-like [Apium graveolens]|uniref:F-box protein CPR1-like n=1 Tax=Apium graveolens TaxID=4045 RepID=UPI003D7AC62B